MPKEPDFNSPPKAQCSCGKIAQLKMVRTSKGTSTVTEWTCVRCGFTFEASSGSTPALRKS